MKNALSQGGWAVAVVMLIAGLFGGEQAKPIDNVVQPAFAPASSPCPDGWRDTSTSDEHGYVLSCSRNGWLVVLDPDGTFNIAWQDGSPTFTADPKAVPGWR